MKFYACALTIILGLTHVSATCIDGHREIVSPGYTVEYKCDVARLGDTPVSAASENACAELYREAGRSGCTYHPPIKRCVIGAEDGREVKSTGSILMVHVLEPEPEPELVDPFAPEDKDPFALDPEAEKAACLEREKESEEGRKACLEREEALKAEHASTKAEKVKVDARLADLMAANCKFYTPVLITTSNSDNISVGPSQHSKYGVFNKREYRFWFARRKYQTTQVTPSSSSNLSS